MRPLRLPIVLVALLALLAVPAGAGAVAPAPAATCAHVDLRPTTASRRVKAGRAVLCLLNHERASRGLEHLRTNSALHRAAKDYSWQMVRKRFFAHVSPGGSALVSRVFGQRWTKKHSSWRLGENIGWGSGELATPARVVDAWMHSPPHRHNILNGRFNEIGIGVAKGAPKRLGGGQRAATYTTDFGRRSGR